MYPLFLQAGFANLTEQIFWNHTFLGGSDSGTKTRSSHGFNLEQWQGQAPGKAIWGQNHRLLLALSHLNRTIMADDQYLRSIPWPPPGFFFSLLHHGVQQRVGYKNAFLENLSLKCALLYEETIWIITGMSHLPNAGLTACVCWPVIRLHMKHKQMHNIGLYSTERLILFWVRVMLRMHSERPRLSVRFSPLTWALVSEGH